MQVRGLRHSDGSARVRPRILKRHPGRPDELERLRELIVGPEQVFIDRTKRVLGDSLPEAIVHAEEHHGPELATALAKPLTSALRDVARREPKMFGEILAPTIGTAVRRAVKETFDALLQHLNNLLERGLSAASVKWRLEAKRTGRPFAEVVLAHTLVYRVEWVVLVHSESGLMLEQASVPEMSMRAPDQVSAMLQAISAFVGDAFQPACPGADLHALEVGDLSVWIERDPALSLAAAIRGVPPKSLRDVLRTTLERIRTLHHEHAIVRLPEPAKFADSRPLLADCLHQQLRRQRKHAQWVLLATTLALATWLAVCAQHARDSDMRHEELRERYLATLSSAPGIFVVSIERSGGGYLIRGLRDPRAEPAAALLARHGLPPATLELSPYDSRDPRFEQPIATAAAAMRALEAIEISFARGEHVVDPAHRDVQLAAALINRAQHAAAQSQLELCVELIGHTDETGSVAVNERLRVARAHGAADAIAHAGVARALLDPTGPRGSDSLRGVAARRVTFRALFRPGSHLRGCAP
jgi:hypothetical protein